jgi:hypothetical protein
LFCLPRLFVAAGATSEPSCDRFTAAATIATAGEDWDVRPSWNPPISHKNKKGRDWDEPPAAASMIQWIADFFRRYLETTA